MTCRAKTAPSGAASTIIQRTSSKEHLQASHNADESEARQRMAQAQVD
jgi:hypothetical protein